MITTKAGSGELLLDLGVESLDASNATEIKQELKSLDVQGVERVRLLMETVNFVDSSGIGTLLSFYKQMEQRVVLDKPTPTVLSVLELLRLHRVFEIETA